MAGLVRGCTLAALSLVLFASSSSSQYMYLDSNGDSLGSSADHMNPPGVPTTVDVWIDTGHNRDGSDAVCNTGDGNLTINSYEFVLHASGGTVSFGSFTNRQAGMTTSFGVASNTTDYHNGFGGGTALSVGRYWLATVQVTALAGNASVGITASTPLGGSYLTSFGTFCSATDLDNTYKLGLDWHDVDGLGVANNPPAIVAPGTSNGVEGSPIDITATASDPDPGQTITITASGIPSFLMLSGQVGASPLTTTLSGTPGYSDAGAYTITWSANDDGAPTATGSGSTVLTVEEMGEPPTLTAPTAVSGSASSPISFSVNAVDPNGGLITSLGASNLPTGATFVLGPGGSQASFDWAPDPDLTGTFAVTFGAASSGGSVEASTNIVVTPPEGPRRPWVSPELKTLVPGQLNSERFLSRASDGQIYVHTFAIGDLSTAALTALGVDVNTRVGRHMTVRCPLENLSVLFEAPEMQAIMAPGASRLLLDSSLVDTHVAGLRTLPIERPLIGQTGADVIVGLVDTGIDWNHPAFKHVNSTTRLVSYWNQLIFPVMNAPPPQPFNYGSEWSSYDINTGFIDLAAADSIGHGTHAAGIAAGNGDGNMSRICGNESRYVGVAPESDLCAVKISPAFRGFYGNTQIVDGVNYIFQKAASLQKPAVVNLSLGSHYGPHDGRAPFDVMINGLTGPGKIVVASAGNDGNSGVHASAYVHFGGVPTPITLQVPDYDPDPFVGGEFIHVQGYFTHGEEPEEVQDDIYVRVITPSGYGGNVEPIHFGQSISMPSTDGDVTVCIKRDCFDSPGYAPDAQIDIFIQAGAGNIRGGLIPWTIELSSPSIEGTGRVDLYLVAANLGSDTPDIRFDLGADPTRTVNSPASADSVIAAGAYKTKDCWKLALNGTTRCRSATGHYGEADVTIGDISAFSSRGPLRDGVTKPDLAAPGEIVVSALSSSASPDVADSIGVSGGVYGVPFGYAALWGTSTAAPLVTGAVALLLAQPGWSTATQGSCRTDAFTGVVPNDTWGYGKLDVRAALSPVLSVEITYPPAGEIITSHWTWANIATGQVFTDSIVVELALDGCNFGHLRTLGPLYLGGPNSGFTYFAPDEYETVTATARMRATAYGLAGSSKAQVNTGYFGFAFGPPPTGVSHEDSPPFRFGLGPIVPNPFNPIAEIRFVSEGRGPATLRIYGIDGRLVRTLVRGTLEPGAHNVTWDGSNDHGDAVASGVYICEFESGGRRVTRKVSLLK